MCIVVCLEFFVIASVLHVVDLVLSVSPSISITRTNYLFTNVGLSSLTRR